ncbi:phosphate acyltransferase [Anaerovorax odorimutans]|uniref:phosphate acyltransferase n=1 Tax=Anaerovorax odorimutans TaxID=109327 RepID=UPI000416DDB1|nr:phosphate acyltransferase [Anaerovorax odorimutans]
MYTNFSQMYSVLQSNKPLTIAVAAAHDETIIKALIYAYEKYSIKSILVGDKIKINQLIKKNKSIFFNPEIIDEKDTKKASYIAAKLIDVDKADILMKGLVNSSLFLNAVLDESCNLKTDKLLSHLSAFQIPGQKKLSFYTDGGINLFPNFEKKIKILSNGIKAMHDLGIKNPNVAILTANEIVNPKMPATIDAKKLYNMNQEGYFPKCIIEGPISLDVALSQESASHKNIKSAISGMVDLFIVPNIEAGNMIGKALIYYAGAKMAGIILGAKCPIVMTSRAETPEGKVNSLALACLLKGEK